MVPGRQIAGERDADARCELRVQVHVGHRVVEAEPHVREPAHGSRVALSDEFSLQSSGFAILLGQHSRQREHAWTCAGFPAIWRRWTGEGWGLFRTAARLSPARRR